MIRTDLHLHSCLSPCAEDEMDPMDIMGMAVLLGIELVALTDHNSAKNCPAAEYAAKERGLGFIPGMEVTSSEEIHCVCLFPTTDRALTFGEQIRLLRPQIKNKPHIFGDQKIVHPDGTVEEEPFLLYPGAGVSVMDLHKLVRSYGGLFWPAHVDRGANSLLDVLGGWPEDLVADAAEVKFAATTGVPDYVPRVNGSDAHRFSSMVEGGFPLPLESADFNGLYKYLRG